MPVQSTRVPARRTLSGASTAPGGPLSVNDQMTAVRAEGCTHGLRHAAPVPTDGTRNDLDGDSRAVLADHTCTASTASHPISSPPANVHPLFRHSPDTSYDLESLTFSELVVIFYAANYFRDVQEVINGPRMVPMIAAVEDVIDEIGMDLVRQTASLMADYESRLQLGKLNDLLPNDTGRRSGAVSNARAFWHAVHAEPSGLSAGRIAQRWRNALMLFDYAIPCTHDVHCGSTGALAVAA